MDTHGCPTDFDELFSTYYDEVVSEARRWVGPKDAEDVAQNIFIRIYETDGLKNFDSSRAKFRTYLKGFTSLKLLWQREKAARLWTNELPLDALDHCTYPDTDFEQVETRVDHDRMLARFRERMSSVQLRPGVLAVEVWDAMAEMQERDEKATGAKLAERFDVPLSTAKRWRSRLVDELREVVSQEAA